MCIVKPVVYVLVYISIMHSIESKTLLDILSLQKLRDSFKFPIDLLQSCMGVNELPSSSFMYIIPHRILFHLSIVYHFVIFTADLCWSEFPCCR